MTIPALFVIASGAGFAVDYSNLSRVRAGLQNSLDSAALAVAQKGKKISNSEAQEIAREYLAGNLPMEFKSLVVTREDQSVTVSADVDVDLYFGHFFGKDKMAVGAVSKADVALISYEIALVLDTTGSMRGRKLRDMKKAVKNLIDNISDQVNDPERLRFALVPFSAFVNVGPQYAPKFDKKGKMIEGTGAALARSGRRQRDTPA
ncbi:pilus assembly protein TadG-related protein [Nitratireductor sp. GISD-1A_MAKvit]|uniref:pilus assembly protein TadG-related protein n=1 Tax=Nitratireductor sp. GISD-1A_MAKvit TaxID=3234198 RepID=UPI003467EA7E